MRFVVRMVLMVLLGSSTSLYAQDHVKWITWEQLDQAVKLEKRKVLVDLYTEWCGWCKKMDKQTFQNPSIASYVNEHYYAIKFDAQYRGDIEHNGRVYKYVRNGKSSYNELAVELSKGKLSFPTIVVLDENLKVIQPIPGFQDAVSFEKIITYFAGNFHRTTPWAEYASSYNSRFLMPARNR